MAGKHTLKATTTLPRARVRPHIPFFKDERVLGVFTTGRAVRVFVLAVVAFVLVCAFGGYELVGAINKINTERHARSKQVTTQINQLACGVVAPFPDNTQYIANLRREYHCPPYDPAITRHLLGGVLPSATPKPRATKPAARPTRSPTPTPAGTVVVPGPTVTSTTTRVVRGHTRTRTRTVTTTVPLLPPLPTGQLCKLIPQLCSLGG